MATTTTDYDASRAAAAEEDSLEELQARRNAPRSDVIDVDDSDVAETFALAGYEQLDEELTAPVVPIRSDEFQCSRCFLVRHRNQRASAAQNTCIDCG